MFACGSQHAKKQYLNKFVKFVNEVKQDYQTYSEEDWQKQDKIFEELCGKDYEKFRDKFSDEEIKKIGQLKGEYQTYKTKYFINQATKGLKNGVKELEGFFQGVTEALTDTLK